MIISEFVQNFKDKKITNTKIAPDAVQQFIVKELEIKKYIPFEEKREIAEIIVEKNTTVVDGIKKYDSISAYVGLVVSAIIAHTNLRFSEDVFADYDLLAESGLLSQIIAEFQESYNECGVILKMAVDMELEDNNPGALIGRFLDGVLNRLDGATVVINELIKNLNLKEMLNEENVVKIIGLLNK